MKLPSEGPNTGVKALIRLLRYCNVGIETLADYKPTITSYIPIALAERKFHEELTDELSWRVQIFVAGGGLITPQDLAREMVKGFQSCPIISESARGALIMVKPAGATASYNDYAAVWKQFEMLTRQTGNGIYQQRSTSAFVSKTRGEGSAARETLSSAARETLQHSEERSPPRDFSGEGRGVAQTPTTSSTKKRTTNINGAEYVEYLVREKRNGKPPDIPHEAIHRDGAYWVPKFFNFRMYFESLNPSKKNQQSGKQGRESAMAARVLATPKTQDVAVSPIDKIKGQACGSDERAQAGVGNAQKTTPSETCLIGTMIQPKPKVLALAVDSACSKAIVKNPNALEKLAHHEVRIDGANPHHPLQSYLGGYINGYVLSESGMKIQFPKDLHVLHCDDSSADLLSVRQCLRNGWCKAILDEKESYLIHQDSGQKIRLRLDGDLYFLDVHLENKIETGPKASDEGFLGRESDDVRAYQVGICSGKLNPCELLHLQTGHPGENNLAAMCRAAGITYRPVECPSCEKAKMVNQRNHESSKHIAAEVGGRVCVDFVEGIGDPHGNGGVKSMLIGTDQYSNKTGTIAVPTNSKIHDLLLKLLEEMFKGEVRVQRIRMDNQLNTAETKKWATEDGIILEVTVPYQHHQNGTQERKNRTVLNSARASMDVCGGRINLLPYAIAHATDAINLWRTETNEKGEMVCPLQKAREEMPTLKTLPIFGCLVVVPVPPDQKSVHTSTNTHMRDRSYEAVYLCRGSPFGKAGILVWDIRTQKIRSVDPYGVKYHQDDFPLRKEQRRLTDLQQLRRQVGNLDSPELEEEPFQEKSVESKGAETTPGEIPQPLTELPLVTTSAEAMDTNITEQLILVSSPKSPAETSSTLDVLQKSEKSNFEFPAITQEPLLETTSKNLCEKFADMMLDPDAPRTKSSSTAADTAQSNAGIPPSYVKASEPQRYAAWERAQKPPQVLPSEEKGEGAEQKEAENSSEEAPTSASTEPEKTESMQETIFTENDQQTSEQAFVAGERGSSEKENGSLTWKNCRKGPEKEMWIAKGKEEVRKFEDSDLIWKINKSEINQLEKDGCKLEVINTFALPQTKFDPVAGTYEKKVRIVADGAHQKFLDIPSTYSPTPAASTIRLAVSLAAENGLPLWHADFTRAFLCSKKVNPNVIHVLRPPPGVEEDNVYWVAKHVVYGFREAPRAFHNTIKPVLEGYGLKQAPGDQCLWFGKDNGTDVHIVVQVDDLMVNSQEKWYKEFIAYLHENGFNIKDMGLAARFMGIEVKQMQNERMIVLSQEHYAKEIVEGCKLDKCSDKPTPLCIPTTTTELEEPCTKDEHAEYRRVIGEVMYLQTMTRPDLAQACSFLSQFLEAPLKWHFMELRRMIRYIRATADRCLVYGGPHEAPKGLNHGEMVCYVDSSWESKRSVSGHIVYRCGGPIVWSSRKQKATALSTAEAEIVAASEAIKSVLALRLILRDIGKEVKGPTVLFEDNQAAIYFAQNEATPPRMKHIDLREHFVRDYVQSGDVRLAKIASAENCADLFTKPLPKEGYSKHRDLMVTKVPNRTRKFPGEVKSPEEIASG